MELDLYLRALQRWWFVPVLLLVLGVGGVWVYHNLTAGQTAQATVVVLQPFLPEPGEYLVPQIGFDSVDEGEELARRVAERLGDGTRPEELRISIDIVSNLNRPNPSLLYGVRAEDKDGQRAIRIANLAAEEARRLFQEINSPDPTNVRAAYADQLQEARQAVDAARAALVAFERENDAYSLNERIDHQMSLVGQLRTMSLSSGGSPGNRSDGEALAAARQELERLLRLQSEYNRLAFEVNLAQAAVARLEQRESDLSLASGGTDPALEEVRAQLQAARQRLEEAQAALNVFETASGASQLPSAIQAQQALVSQLIVAQAASQARAGALGEALRREQAELDRLLSLKPQYDKLSLGLQKAEGQLSKLEDTVIDIQARRTLPAQPEVKVMQEATLQSDLWWLLLTYGLATALSLFLGLTAIYLLAYFHAMPWTAAELEGHLGWPVLAQVPRLQR